ncbi:MAG: hypothetical protein ABSF76_14850 [Opitutaceae bacterium]
MRPFSKKGALPKSERGAAMLAALCLAMVFAISLSSYLALCYTSLSLSTRTVAISHSSELAEAGVEQALYALNNNVWTNWNLSGSTASATMTMTSSGLVLTSTNPTPLNYGNGIHGQVAITVQNYYTNLYSTATPGPLITSQATMTLPAYAGVSTPSVSTTVNYGNSSSISSEAAPLFVNAVAATSTTLRFKSAGTVDSYNSNPSSGVYQKYSAGVAGYSAIVLSQDNVASTATVRLGNAVVHGYAAGYDYSSPGTTNWLSYSASGKIIGPSTPGTTYIDSSRLVTSPVPYQPLFLENLPSNWSSLPAGCTTDGMTINKTYTLGSTTASAPTILDAGNGISLSGNQLLTIQGPVVVICYGNVTITGAAGIQLTTPQASLQIFIEYGNLSLGGNGITNTNLTPLPKKVCILDTTNTWSTVTYSTNSPYYGVIYFPYLPISVTSTNPVTYGSIVGSSVTFTYSPTIHYDRALRSPTTAYTVSTPLQSGAAFDYLEAPAAFSGLVTSVQ